ncbi:hypothetical protein Y032_0023g679 [Ancylostoma ceylanicum]|uniref:Cytoplasmic tRNA 2-thiolation protein 1 C-terminal domain-containing protein n=1 Tax=Ancylostoma ceylanicum TaxID=53326 RepID=A0A016UY66_9BILA|nr:hypothetical protein Y032_0023g679 [Ancylostoma ceylanicum]
MNSYSRSKKYLPLASTARLLSAAPPMHYRTFRDLAQSTLSLGGGKKKRSICGDTAVDTEPSLAILGSATPVNASDLACYEWSNLMYYVYCFEKDIVMYARLNKLDYFYTECIYAPDSYRAYSRSFVKELERMRPECILGLIKSGESMMVKAEVSMPTLINCTRCGYISSQTTCKACLLLEGLNTGRTDMGVRRKPKKLTVAAENDNEKSCGGSCSCEKNTDVEF